MYCSNLTVYSSLLDWLENELKFRRIWVKEKNRNLNLTDEDVERLANEDFQKFRANARKWRNINYVNCWHVSDYESEAMWRLYTGGEGNGVAIQTTFERLYNALPLDFSVDFGLVNYINYRDYNTGSSGKSIHPFLAPWYKRESFAHEKEFRVKVEDVDRKSTRLNSSHC